MPTFSQLPGDLTITFVGGTVGSAGGDEVNFTIDLDVDCTGYTWTAGIYVVSTAGFAGGGSGLVTTVGSTAATPTITVTNAANGLLTWGLNETQTGALSSGIKYRHFLRYQTSAGFTRTIVSGDVIVKAP
jgi:hypothetical protein